jgi:arylsulfatase A-like enzyme
VRRTALLLDLDDRRRGAAHMRPPSPLRTAPCVRVAVCAVLVFAGCASIDDEPRRRPNVVVILVDDMGWRDVGPYGQRFAETPRIDALARQGTTFDAAYAACPVCSPTRAALLTGKYPPRVNITDWIPGNADRDKPLVPPQDRDDLAPEETTLAEALRAQGYSTFHVGKWHLGGAGRLPEDQGFDVNVMGGPIGHPASYFFPYGAATATRPAHSHAVPALPPGGAPGDYLTARQAAEAVRLIAGAATADRPFLLYLPFYSVHAPLEAPAETVEKYRRKKATAEGAAAAGAMRPVHAAMVEETDRAVGRVLDALDAAGVAENTLVVFTSDNGGVGGATDLAPLRGSKRTLYEGGVRVPLVVRYPGVARAGARTNVVAITQDLFATACAAAGAETVPGSPDRRARPDAGFARRRRPRRTRRGLLALPALLERRRPAERGRPFRALEADRALRRRAGAALRLIRGPGRIPRPRLGAAGGRRRPPRPSRGVARVRRRPDADASGRLSRKRPRARRIVRPATPMRYGIGTRPVYSAVAAEQTP